MSGTKRLTKSCIRCGATYHTWREASTFCSMSCYRQHTAKKDIPCRVCGGLFKRRQGDENHCSPECGHESRRKEKLKKICAQCGKLFYVPPGYQYQICCGEKCGRLHAANTIRQEWPTVSCPQCGKGFVRRGSDTRTFCSLTCYRETLQPLVTLTCETCGAGYERKANRTAKSRYCSRPCQTRAMAQNNRVSEPVPKRRGANWDDQSAKVRKRDKSTCQHCKRVKTDRYDYFDVHHIIPYRLFNGDYKKANELSNLVLLCRSCHGKADKTYRRQERIQAKAK